MTTGEKIAKLRKDKGLTQEDFGELLNVTRQSVSKWESDLSFPETDKLILIAKHFNCSLDYLLNNEFNNEQISKKEKMKILNGSLINGISLIVYPVIMLILYFLPIARLKPSFLGSSIWYEDYYVTVNFYNFLFSSNYKLGNIIFLTHFICIVLIIIVGILILFFNDKRLYKTNLIVSIISVISILLIFILIVSSSSLSFGIIIMLLLNISYFGLLLFNRRKKHEKIN